jgi:nitroimidazol reductase NimA-like FMN-containing flavoprotein (pyridoxamine 5'-phosphate oxidase superfamily)
MGDEGLDLRVEELLPHECWALLRTASIGRLAVWVENHPDIFPLNYAVDHGSIVFRSRSGTKVSAALSDSPVALEADGYDAETNKAWSVVARGDAKEIDDNYELIDTLDLPLFPWQAGEKGHFVRIDPDIITGRRFSVVDPTVWQTPLSGMKRSSID